MGGWLVRFGHVAAIRANGGPGDWLDELAGSSNNTKNARFPWIWVEVWASTPIRT